MDIESTFVKVFGRAPAEDERVFLQRLAGTWNVRGNEALLALLFVLQFGSGYQRYPARCAESVRRAVRLALQQSGAHGTIPRARQSEIPLWQSTSLTVVAWIAIIVTGLTSLSMGASSHSVLMQLILGTPPVGAVQKALTAIMTASAGWTNLAVATPTACWIVVGWLQRGRRQPSG